jgi:hypothetical protein
VEVLHELAATAERQPAPPGNGPYSYIRTRGWYRGEDRTPDGRPRVRVEETEREFWIAADGSGRIAETRDGRPSPVNGTFGPGGLHPGPLAHAPAGVPPEVALRQSASPLPVGWLRDIRDAWLVQVVPPALQAALLRRLARLDGVRLADATDRAGRPGVAVSAEDGRRRVVLVLDRDTGGLLAAEEGTTPTRGLPGCTLWLRSGYAPDTRSRP